MASDEPASLGHAERRRYDTQLADALKAKELAEEQRDKLERVLRRIVYADQPAVGP